MDYQIVANGQHLAVFNSTHRVMKAESILKSKGCKATLIPAPRALQTDCGLAIRFDENISEEVMRTLKETDLLPSFLCRREGDGFIKIEEYTHENN